MWCSNQSRPSRRKNPSADVRASRSGTGWRRTLWTTRSRQTSDISTTITCMARPRSRTQALDVLFGDTVFWFGLARNRDQHRARDKAWKAWLDAVGARLVTTEAVHWEWLNAEDDVVRR